MNDHITPHTGDIQKAPHIPSGDEVYREIMSGIEQDLLLS